MKLTAKEAREISQQANEIKPLLERMENAIIESAKQGEVMLRFSVKVTKELYNKIKPELESKGYKCSVEDFSQGFIINW